MPARVAPSIYRQLDCQGVQAIVLVVWHLFRYMILAIFHAVQVLAGICCLCAFLSASMASQMQAEGQCPSSAIVKDTQDIIRVMSVSIMLRYRASISAWERDRPSGNCQPWPLGTLWGTWGASVSCLAMVRHCVLWLLRAHAGHIHCGLLCLAVPLGQACAPMLDICMTSLG